MAEQARLESACPEESGPWVRIPPSPPSNFSTLPSVVSSCSHFIANSHSLVPIRPVYIASYSTSHVSLSQNPALRESRGKLPSGRGPGGCSPSYKTFRGRVVGTKTSVLLRQAHVGTFRYRGELVALSATRVRALKKPGRYFAGGGLHLHAAGHSLFESTDTLSVQSLGSTGTRTQPRYVLSEPN